MMINKTPEKAPKTEEFTRFQELAKNLIAVPKEEVDKQKAKYEKGKEKRPVSR